MSGMFTVVNYALLVKRLHGSVDYHEPYHSVVRQKFSSTAVGHVLPIMKSHMARN